MLRHVFRHYSTTAIPKKTRLYDFHVSQGGKMVEFAGWQMPVQYANKSLIQSHFWTRECASLFDVSHMLQSRFKGPQATRFLESLVVADLKELPPGRSTLSVFTHENGGIIDDTVINKVSDEEFYVVSNAGCADKDLAHIRHHLSQFGGGVTFEVVDTSLVALQGPKAAAIIEMLSGSSVQDFAFMSGRHLTIHGIPVYISRCGYTGEDGFEISVSHDKVEQLCDIFISRPEVELAGLGARDSLRLEAGLCLYGHDIDETTSPVEAALTWTIGQRRRKEGGFLGADKILPQIKGGVSRRRVGLIVQGAPARENAPIFDMQGNPIGKVTSGCPSPCLKKNVAMGYIQSGFHKNATPVQVQVRNKMQEALVTKMPFVPHQYYRGV